MHPTQNPAKDDLRMSWDSASCQQAHELGATKQLQEALELASMGGGGLELEGKSASIKSISDSIQSSMACCLSSNASALSVSGLRRQLSIRKKERKGDSDEPHAPLLLEGDDVAGEVDVVIGRKQGNQADHETGESFDRSGAVDNQSVHQPRNPALQPAILVHVYCMRQGVWVAPGSAKEGVAP